MSRTLIIAVAVVALLAGVGLARIGSGAAGQTTTVTQTISATPATVTNTQTVGLVSTVTSLRDGAVLVNYTGFGDANTPPFTATTAVVQITLAVTVTSDNASFGGVSWYLYQTSGPALFDQGSVNGKSGSFEFYSYNLVPGSTYYLKILAANADWNVVVNEAK